MKSSYPLVLAGAASLAALPVMFSAETEPEKAGEPRLSRSDAGLVEIVLDDGAVQVDFDGRFQTVSMARIGGGGAIERGCANSEDGMLRFMRTGGSKPEAE